ncbi:MAG: hypothetical protein LBD18_06195 [Treponema sp.]|jgi:hypothetical protein|nr:hypothetical protein [Treponema sp.]
MSVLKKAIDALDPAPDKKKEITLALSLLFENVEKKIELQEAFLKNYLRTAGTEENPTVPITNILGWHREGRAYIKSDASKLVGEVTGALKKFISGGTEEIISGIGDLLVTGLTVLLGSGSGDEGEMQSYFIAVEGLAITRIDVVGWQRHIEVAGFTSQIEHALAFTVSKSSVNVDKITFNTFLQAYNAQLQKMKIPKDQLKIMIVEAKEVFELLRDKDISVAAERPLVFSIEPGTIAYKGVKGK